MKTMSTYIGFDIGKRTIHYAYSTAQGTWKTGSFTNDKQKIAAFLKPLPIDAHGIMEATGLYHFPLAYALQEAGIALSILNPCVSSAYAKSLASISKTDQADALLLARFGKERQPASTQLASKAWQAFRHKLNHQQNLQADIQKVKNRLSELDFYPMLDKRSHEMMLAQLAFLEKQYEQLSQDIESQLPEIYAQDLVYATSIKGIGRKTALFLLCFTQGLATFEQVSSLAKFIGIAPTVYQSGNYKQRGRITKKGNAVIRSLLYNCAKSAKRFNKACKALYERLREKGKPHKVAMVAVMHKLLRQFFACVKHQTMYQEERVAN
jgi:transposase